MKKWFSNLKFRYKLLMGITAVTTLILLLISQLSYTYFYKRNTREVLTKAENSVQMASSTLAVQFDYLNISTNYLLLTEPYPQMISDINHDRFTGYSKYFSDATDAAALYLQNNGLVNTLLLCGEDGILFSPSALGPIDQQQNLFEVNIWNHSRISVFPCQYNTLFKQDSAIPISYPVSSRIDNKFINYADIDDTTKARFVILLDTAQVHSYFDRMSNSYTYCMYLADSRGTPLDITPEQYPDAFLPEVTSWVTGTNGYQESVLTTTGDELFLNVDSIKFCDLKIVHLTKKSALTGDVKEFRTFFVIVWLFCTIIASLIAFALSHLLTRNIKVLNRIISQINTHAYEKKAVFSNSDEISLLGIQLNQMYDTIQFQLEQIKEEEQKKAQTEIQMLSEQINPHFLYNTLECIHFQIMGGHTDVAGEMLESLGRYLRITLSLGKTLIPMHTEAEHVTSYMEIINRHSTSGIRFSCHLDPALYYYEITKLILQPLVENSIKHGFNGAVTGLEPVPPQIEIFILPEAGHFIKIIVSDNGKGIDIAKATACLTADDPDRKHHFALSNIYRRLKACYGEDAQMTFSSIPYFKNSVIITFPTT